MITVATDLTGEVEVFLQVPQQSPQQLINIDAMPRTASCMVEIKHPSRDMTAASARSAVPANSSSALTQRQTRVT